MLVPTQKVENVEYKDRTGTVHTPSPDSVFMQRHGAFLIYMAGEMILLSRSEHSGGDWELPGGGVDEGETAEQGLIRETFEETTVHLPDDVQLQKRYSNRIYYFALDNGQFWNYDQDYFILKTDDTSQIFDGIVKSIDNCDARWCKLSVLAETDIRHDHKMALKSLGMM